jgi:hypothetical protein
MSNRIGLPPKQVDQRKQRYVPGHAAADGDSVVEFGQPDSSPQLDEMPRPRQRVFG